MFSLDRSCVCIVGAGLSGIEAAKIMRRSFSRVVVFEKSSSVGGVWRRAANLESRVQVDPISFAPIEDDCPVRKVDESSVFDSVARPKAEVLERLINDAADLEIWFETEVISFKVMSSSVSLVLRRNATLLHFEVAQLHIRTGCLHDPIKPSFRGMDIFRGQIVQGVGNDISIEQFRDTRVVIVGLGAFAVENVKRALQGSLTYFLLPSIDSCVFDYLRRSIANNSCRSYFEASFS